MKLKVEIEYSGAEAKKVMARLFEYGVAVKKVVVEKAKRKVGRPKKIVKPPRVHRMSGQRRHVITRRQNVLTLLERNGSMTSKQIAEVIGEPLHNILYDLHCLSVLKRIEKHGKLYALYGVKIQKPAQVVRIAKFPAVFVKHFRGDEPAMKAISDFVKWADNKKQITSNDYMQFCFGMPVTDMTDGWIWMAANLPAILDYNGIKHDKVKVSTVNMSW